MMELIFAFDPLCMWSYAFSHVLEEFVAKHKNEFFTSVICSGMIRGDLVSGIGTQKEQLLNASEIISCESGIPFGPAFYDNIENNRALLDSVPGSTAVNILKHANKRRVLEFAIQLSRNIFAHGFNPSDYEKIARFMATYGVDYDEALHYLTSDNGKYLAFQDFQWFEAASMKRTPVLLLEIEGELIQLTQGYTEIGKLESVYQMVLKEHHFLLN